MINLYAYTYPAAIKEYKPDGYILTKVGDSHRDVDVRMREQGGAAEYQKKIVVGRWNNLQRIHRDYAVHEILRLRGLHHTDGEGTEWFKIPADNEAGAFSYIDTIVKDLEGRKVRNHVKLRDVQQRNLDKALAIIANCERSASIIANLCPRFGKTIWALMLFNEISKRYGNRVMLLPAYWLSVHSSFEGELDAYEDFNDIVYIDVDKPQAPYMVGRALEDKCRVVIPMSLHGDYESWCEKHSWIRTIPNEEIFNFSDEGDFGTHTENQVKKLQFLFDK